MSAFDEAWGEIGQTCNVCEEKHYNRSDYCGNCSQTEQKLRQSGAYRQPAPKPNLSKVINRLIWEERDRRTQSHSFKGEKDAAFTKWMKRWAKESK